MSNSSLFGRRPAPSRTVPRGEVLGEYESYSEAQKVVNRLAKADVALTGVAIVGSDLTMVERVTGRMSYGRAAITGAASGSWLGAMVGLVLILITPTPDVTMLVAVLLIGAGFGVMARVASYAMNRQRRDYTATHQVLASTYRVIIDPAQAVRARNVLAGFTTTPSAAEERAEES